MQYTVGYNTRTAYVRYSSYSHNTLIVRLSVIVSPRASLVARQTTSLFLSAGPMFTVKFDLVTQPPFVLFTCKCH